LAIHNRICCFEQINFTTKDYFIKHANITTIYKDNQNREYIQKLLKCRAGLAQIKKPSSLIKMREEAQKLLAQSRRITLFKEENVS
jgi:hypothetical protein